MTSIEITPRPTIEIPKSLFKEYGEERQSAHNWKTIVFLDANKVIDHVVHLHEIIGLGCQGTVYNADSDIHGNIVVKEMKRREVDTTIHNIAAQLGIGPEILGTHYDHSNGMFYIAFEKLERMITFQDMASPVIGHMLCESITFLIENGIFHNDIRGANIMIDSRGKVRLVDYDYSTLAWSHDRMKPHLSMPEYDDYLRKNYNICIDEQNYTLNFPYEMQQRHLKARINFENLLIQNFILGVGYN
jgi:serine/threonine protein kinase